MKLAGYFSALTLLLLLASGCSVGSTSMPVAPNGYPEIPTSDSPSNPNPEQPNPDQETVIVSEPMPVNSIARQPVSGTVDDSDSTDNTSPTSPLEPAPSGDRLGDQPSSPYHRPSENRDDSKDTADFDDNSPDSIAPEPIGINKEPDYSGDAQLINATDIVSVTAPSESEAAEPSQTNSNAPVKPENEFDRIPSGIMDSIDIGSAEPILADAGIPSSNLESDSTEYDTSDDVEIDILVAGSCLGKKKVGVVWYDKRRPEKKNKSVNCKNGQFETKIKVNKKDVDYVDVQTLFFN